MKLIDLLPVFDDLNEVVLWHEEQEKINGEDKPVFEGSIFDIPYGYLDCELYTPKGGDAPCYVGIVPNFKGRERDVAVLHINIRG